MEEQNDVVPLVIPTLSDILLIDIIRKWVDRIIVLSNFVQAFNNNYQSLIFQVNWIVKLSLVSKHWANKIIPNVGIPFSVYSGKSFELFKKWSRYGILSPNTDLETPLKTITYSFPPIQFDPQHCLFSPQIPHENTIYYKGLPEWWEKADIFNFNTTTQKSLRKLKNLKLFSIEIDPQELYGNYTKDVTGIIANNSSTLEKLCICSTDSYNVDQEMADTVRSLKSINILKISSAGFNGGLSITDMIPFRYVQKIRLDDCNINDSFLDQLNESHCSVRKLYIAQDELNWSQIFGKVSHNLTLKKLSLINRSTNSFTKINGLIILNFLSMNKTLKILHYMISENDLDLENIPIPISVKNTSLTKLITNFDPFSPTAYRSTHDFQWELPNIEKYEILQYPFQPLFRPQLKTFTNLKSLYLNMENDLSELISTILTPFLQYKYPSFTRLGFSYEPNLYQTVDRIVWENFFSSLKSHPSLKKLEFYSSVPIDLTLDLIESNQPTTLESLNIYYTQCFNIADLEKSFTQNHTIKYFHLYGSLNDWNINNNQQVVEEEEEGEEEEQQQEEENPDQEATNPVNNSNDELVLKSRKEFITSFSNILKNNQTLKHLSMDGYDELTLDMFESEGIDIADLIEKSSIELLLISKSDQFYEYLSKNTSKLLI
eukprot:gene1563-1982_t